MVFVNAAVHQRTRIMTIWLRELQQPSKLILPILPIVPIPDFFRCSCLIRNRLRKGFPRRKSVVSRPPIPPGHSLLAGKMLIHHPESAAAKAAVPECS